MSIEIKTNIGVEFAEFIYIQMCNTFQNLENSDFWDLNVIKLAIEENRIITIFEFSIMVSFCIFEKITAKKMFTDVLAINAKHKQNFLVQLGVDIEDDFLYITGIVSLKKNQGYGAAMIKFVKNKFSDKKIFLESRSESVGFYLKMGFKNINFTLEDGRIPMFFRPIKTKS